MSYLKRTSTLVVALGLFITLGLSGAWADAGAQTVPGGGYGVYGGGYGVYGAGPRLGENVELALANADRLGLTEAQVVELQAIGEGVRREVVPLQEELASLRARISSGAVTYGESAGLLRGLLVEIDEVAAPYRRGVAETLTPEQHAELRRMMYATRAYPGWGYGRGSSVRGTGVWRGRGGGFGGGTWARPGRAGQGLRGGRGLGGRWW